VDPARPRVYWSGKGGSAVTVDLDRHSEDHGDWTGEVLERVEAFPALEAVAKMSESAFRRDNTDRSLARSAWESVLRKTVPSGTVLSGAANPRGISRRNVRLFL
jgi:hypothetical protein